MDVADHRPDVPYSHLRRLAEIPIRMVDIPQRLHGGRVYALQELRKSVGIRVRAVGLNQQCHAVPLCIFSELAQLGTSTR